AGAPRLTIDVGGQTRYAEYLSGSGNSVLRFRYTVAAGDNDVNGISVPAGSVVLNSGTIRDLAGTDAVLTHAGAADDATYRVDTTAPTIASVAIGGQTGAQNNLLNAGDTVTVLATFSEAVFFDTTNGSPLLAINVGGVTRSATYVAGAGTTTLQFRYSIVAGDADVDGISVDANSLTFAGGTMRDLAGNAASLAHSAVPGNAAYKVDTQAATITSLVVGGETGAENGRLNAGDTLTLEVSFDEVVTVDTAAGSPILRVNVGGQLRAATYAGGSGTDKLQFVYTVASGDNDTDGVSVDPNAIALNGGKILDLAGNAVHLTHASLADQAAHKVDTTAATVTQAAVQPSDDAINGWLGVGGSITASLTFDETVTVDTTGGLPSIRLLVGGVEREAVYIQGSGGKILTFGYVVQAGDNDSDGVTVVADSLTLAGGIIRDLAGNAASLAHGASVPLPENSVDTTVPAITSVVIGGAEGIRGDLLNEFDVVTFNVAFDEIVYVNEAGGTPTIRIDVGGVQRLATYTGGSGTSTLQFSYEIVAGDDDADGISIAADGLELNGAIISDLVGNAAALEYSAVADDSGYKVDTRAPTISSVEFQGSSSDIEGWLRAGHVVTVAVTFDEVVLVDTGAGVPTLTIDVGGVAREAVYQDGSGGNVLLFSYTIEESDIDADGLSIGDNAVSLQGGVISDAGGTEADLSHAPVSDDANYKVDTRIPSIVSLAVDSTLGMEGGQLNEGDEIVFSVTFDEDVFVAAGADLPTLTLNVGGVDGSAVYSHGSGSNILFFRYVVQAGELDADGVSVGADALVLADSSIRDIAGNDASLANLPLADDILYPVDAVEPSIVDVSIIEASTNVEGWYRAGDVVSFLVSFSEVVSVDLTNGEPVLRILIGGVEREATYVEGSGTDSLYFSYEFVAGDNDADGIAIAADALAAAGARLTDSAGTDASLSHPEVPDMVTVKVDTTSPEVLSIVLDAADSDMPGWLREGQTVTLAVRFSEAVEVDTASGTPQLRIRVGDQDRIAAYIDGSGSDELRFSYVVQAGDNDADGISVPADSLELGSSGIRDVAGNDAILTHGELDFPDAGVDTIAPVLLSASVTESTGAILGWSRDGDVITVSVLFSEAVLIDESAGLPTLRITLGAEERDANYLSGTGSQTLLFTYTVTEGDSAPNGVGIVASSITGHITDLAGNPAGLDFGSVSPDIAYRIDTVIPTVVSVAVEPSASGNGWLHEGDEINLLVTFDETLLIDTTFGSPTLRIRLGDTEGLADYVSGPEGTNVLMFRYVVGADELDINGISVVADGLDLNGAVVTDEAGNDALLAYAGSGDLADQKVDSVLPTIVSLVPVSEPASGLLKAGDSVVFEATFSEIVFVDTTDGTPRLTISVGGIERAAIYSSGSGTETLQFTYIVEDGDADADGISVVADSLDGFGGTIRDLSGNDAITAHPGLSDDGMLVVDTAAPIVTSLQLSRADGAAETILRVGETVLVTMSFSEAVFVEGQPTVEIMVGGSARSASMIGGSGTDTLVFSYTVASGDDDADGISIGQDSLVLGHASIRDAAGNDVVPDHGPVADVAALQVDTTHPAISHIGISGSDQSGAALVAGDTLYVSVSFTEAVTVDLVGDQPYVSIQVGGETRRAHYVSGSGTDVLAFSYTVEIADMDADGVSVPANALEMNGSVIQDLAGNEAIVASDATPDDASAIVDAVQPFVVSATVAETDAADGLWSHSGDTVFIDLAFSEAVLVDVSAGTPTLLIQVGSETRHAVYAGGSGSAILQFSYQVQPGDDAPAGIGVPADALSLNGASISDLAGNEALLANAQSEPDPSFRIDAVVPSITSIELETVEKRGVDSLIENDSVSFAVRFTEAVSVETVGGTPVLRILVGGMEREAIYTSGSGTDLLVFTYVVGADDRDPDGLSVAAGALDLAGGMIRDISGNDALLEHGSLADDPSLTVDGTSPAVVDVGFDMVRTDLVNGFVGADRPVYVTVAFNDMVLVDTGSGQPSLRLLVGGFERQAVYVDGSGSAVLTFAYVPDAGDTDGDGIEIVPDSLALNGATITDAVGNAALLDHGGQDGVVVIRVDAEAPTITDVALDSLQGAVNALVSAGDTVTFALNFSKDVYVEMQGGVPGVLVDVGGVQKIARYVHGSGSGTLYFAYVVQDGDRDEDGITLIEDSLFLDGSSIMDLAGNAAGMQHGGLQGDSEYGVDTDAPYVLSLSAVPAQSHEWLTLGQSVTIAVKFSKVVEVDAGAGIPGVLLDIGGAERMAYYVSGSGSDELIFSYEVQAGDADVDGVTIVENGIRLTGGVISDRAGNAADLTSAAVVDDAFVKVDATIAQIQSLAISEVAASEAGWLKLGDSVSFSVTFDKAVVVDTALGEPHLRIMLGGQERFASFAGGSGSDVLTFTYTISAGDEAFGGISVPATSLEPGTATIRDLAGNEAVLTHAELPADPAMGVDAVAPSAVEVLIAADAGEYSKVGDAIVVTVRFTQDVIVDLAGGRPFIGVRVGEVDRQAAYAGGAGTDTLTFVYIVAEEDLDEDGVSVGENRIDLSGGRIHDLAGNDAVLDHAAVAEVAAVKVDTVAPTIQGVTVAETTGQSGVPLTVGDTITFAMTFDSPLVIDLSSGVPELRILLGAAERFAIFSGLDGDRVLRFTYSIVDGDEAPAGITVPADSLYLGAAIVTDAAGNAASTLHPAMDEASEYEVDAAAPAAPLLTLAGNLAGGATLAEASQGTGLIQVAGEAGGEITVSFANGANKITKILTGSGAAQSIALTEQEVLELGSGTISVSASERDAVGNRSVTATTQFTLDMQAPTVGHASIAGATGMVGSYANTGDIINLTLTFSEAVQVSGIPNLRFQIGANTRRASYVSGSGTTTLTFAYRVQDGENDADGISIAADGVVLNGGRIDDISGNPAVLAHAAVAANAAYLVDTTKPLLTQTSFAGLAHILPTTPLVLTFDKAVVAGTGVIRLDNGSGDVRTISVTDSSQVTISGHTVTIAPAGGLQPFGTYQISFGKGVILDTIGNAFTGIAPGNQSVPVWSPAVQLSEVASGDGGFVASGSATAHAGQSVAGLGDINGDGLADTAVAVPGSGSAGRVHIVFGRSGNTPLQLSGLGTAGITIEGDTAGWPQGVSVAAAGDVNGDGLSDILIGVPNVGGSGAAYVVFGRSAGASIALSSLGTAGLAITGFAAGEAAGTRVAAIGDVNGDGFSDILVGAPGSVSGAGSSYVIFGRSAPASIDVTALGSSGFSLVGESALDHSGSAIAGFGDVNGDGLADILVGSAAAGGGKGRVYVVFGHTGTFATQNLSGIAAGNGGFVIQGAGTGSGAGASVSLVGDVNGDGLADIFVATQGAAKGYLVFGRTGTAPVDLAAPGSQAFAIMPEGTSLSAAVVSSAGDINGDGLADLAIVVPDALGGKGRAYIVFGRTGTSQVDLSAVAAGSGGIVIDGASSGDGTGMTVTAAGDVNGDGLADLVVGVPSADQGAGRAYVVLGRTDKAFKLTAIDRMGTAGADALSDGQTPHNVMAGAGNDTITLTARGSTANAGSGNDTIAINQAVLDGLTHLYDGSVERTHIEGGAGIDTLAFSELAMVMDLSKIAGTAGNGRLEGIERFDLTGTGNNRLIVSPEDVAVIGRFDTFQVSGRQQLMVAGNVGDVLELTGRSGWVTGGTLSYGGQTYNIWNDMGGASAVYVQQGVEVTGRLAMRLVSTNPSANGVLSAAQNIVLEFDTDVSRGSGNIVLSDGLGDTRAISIGDTSQVTISGRFLTINPTANLVAGRPYTLSMASDVVLGPDNKVFLGIADGTVHFDIVKSQIELSDVAAGNGGFAINAAAAGDQIGTSVSHAGDVNADGISDFIVSAPAKGAYRGHTYVVFGRTGTWALDTSAIAGGSDTSAFAIIGEGTGVYSGYSVAAAGDVNGDGFADIVLGSYGSATGRAFVVFGRSAGGPAVTLSALGTSGFQMTGEGGKAGFGVSGIGDINGDGLADLVVGAPEYGTSTGRAYIVYGRTGTSTIDLSAIAAGSGGFAITGSASDYLGSSVSAAGDVNGDGLADILIGAKGTGTATGRTYLIYGRSGSGTGFTAGLAMGTNGFAIVGDTASGQSGYSVSYAGDVNGDGLADMIVGSPAVGSGKAFVIFGRTNAAAAIMLSALGASEGFAINGESAGDFAGLSVSYAGDVNGDGLADLIVGAYQNDGSGNNAGRAYLVYGRTGGTVNLSAIAQGSGGFAMFGESASSQTGIGVSYAGDVNGDGFSDLIVGANGYSSNAGRAYVVFGGSTGPFYQTTVDAVGTSAAETFQDGASAKTIYALGGDDTITLTAAGSVAYGGVGNDVISVNAAMIASLQSAYGQGGNVDQSAHIAGGVGVDTLKLSGAGLTLDLTQVGNAAAGNPSGGSRLESIEKIDITGTGDNVLKLTAADIADMSGINLFETTGRYQLMVDGNAGDKVQLTDGRWARQAASFTSGGNSYNVFYNVAKATTLYVRQGVVVDYPGIEATEIVNGYGGFVINGESAGNYTGFGISSAGDFNGDGLNDLIVSAYRSDAGAQSAGRAYIVYGRTGTTSVNLSAVAAGNGGFAVSGEAGTSYLGYSVSAAGDVNGDGLADIVLGAYGYNGFTGRAYVIFGRTDGASPALSAIVAGSGGFVVISEAAGSYFGRSVAGAGDVNGDGLADVIIGANAYNSSTGRAYVIFGKTSGGAVNASAIANGSGGFALQGDTTGVALGGAVSGAGDVNGDGLADVVIGAGGYSSNTGRSYVVFGKTGGSIVTISALGTGGFSVTGETATGNLGYDVSYAGDVNGDGLADIVVGAPNVGSNAGRAYVIFGRSAGNLDINVSSASLGTNGFAIVAEGTGDLTASNVSYAGDVNGDGLADILVGGRRNDTNGVDAGRAYLVYGRTATTSVILSDVAKGIGGFAISGECAGDELGLDATAAGDINGDGLADILVGAQYNDANGADSGRAYVIFGRTDGTSSSVVVDVMGTASAEALSDGGTGKYVLAGAGDDTLTLTAASVMDG
ncbi:FG-GAP-like repeat-containing protein, partial [Aureimonas altamirensis]|uniref:Ig-like domain-containing protein n=1 Tax=Aureimonas altamirensis TaxID=370622 RepID=UPI0020366AA9